MSVKQVLIDARKKIEREENWMKHGTWEEGNKFCALGAVLCIVPHDNELYVESIMKLKKSLPEGFVSVISFNDDDRTSHKDILALFDKAIESCKDEINSTV